jgi:hypothetical protein
MSFIKKTELKNLIIESLKQRYENIDFKWIKSESRFVKQTNGGLLMFECKVIDAYNFEKDEVAWKVEVNFYIGFEAVHKWFEAFEHRKKDDYKYFWTYADNLENTSGCKFQIDVDSLNVNNFIIDLIEKLDVGLKKFYNSNRYLSQLKIAKELLLFKKIEDVRAVKFFNSRSAFELLSISWVLRQNNFDKVLDLFKLRILELVNVGDPMAKFYYPQFEEIIKALKNNDFSNSILELDDNVLI